MNKGRNKNRHTVYKIDMFMIHIFYLLHVKLKACQQLSKYNSFFFYNFLYTISLLAFFNEVRLEPLDAIYFHLFLLLRVTKNHHVKCFPRPPHKCFHPNSFTIELSRRRLRAQRSQNWDFNPIQLKFTCIDNIHCHKAVLQKA